MIHFQIATPEHVIYQADVEKVSVPTELGQITVLANHIPLIATLVPGEMIIYDQGEARPYAVSGGFIEVRPGSHVIILADSAERVEEIDVERAEAAKERAKKLMEAASRDEVQFAEASALLERSLARIRLARKRGYRTQRPDLPKKDSD